MFRRHETPRSDECVSETQGQGGAEAQGLEVRRGPLIVWLPVVCQRLMSLSLSSSMLRGSPFPLKTSTLRVRTVLVQPAHPTFARSYQARKCGLSTFSLESRHVNGRRVAHPEGWQSASPRDSWELISLMSP